MSFPTSGPAIPQPPPLGSGHQPGLDQAPRRPNTSQRAGRALRGAVRAAGSASQAARRHTNRFLGGSDRARVIVTLTIVLALSSADATTVGAAASELRSALHISNTDVGLLVSVTAAVGALASLPFGILVDRVSRTRLLAASTLLWGVAMIASATVGNFKDLLFTRVFLGVVTAVAGPAVASLVGDYFPGNERGTIYGYILTGDLIGGGVGFFVTGDVAAISWQAAFVVLALPAFWLAWRLKQLPEPARSGRSRLDSPHPESGFEGHPGITDVQRLALDKGVRPNAGQILTKDPRKMSTLAAVRYVLGVRTNVVLVASGAFAYFFLTGVQTFGLEFVREQYHIGTVLASLLMLVVGTGAVGGVLAGGFFGDRLTRRGHINGRMAVAGVSAALSAVLFAPPLLLRSSLSALPYITAAAFFLTAQNPALDAARLDVVPPLLWGRAEGIRTLLRSAAQGVAPVTFGALADLLAGTHHGLRDTFLIMLIPLAASAWILLRGLRHYPADVATAALSAEAEPLG